MTLIAKVLERSYLLQSYPILLTLRDFLKDWQVTSWPYRSRTCHMALGTGSRFYLTLGYDLQYVRMQCVLWRGVLEREGILKYTYVYNFLVPSQLILRPNRWGPTLSYTQIVEHCSGQSVANSSPQVTLGFCWAKPRSAMHRGKYLTVQILAL